MNIAIVDDLYTDRTLLSNFIKKYASENFTFIQLTEYESGEEFLSKADLSVLDVVFLDIYMVGINGMEVAQKIREVGKSCLIIFVTTTVAFAVQSYEVRAFHYLLKPYTYEKFATIMELLEKSAINSSRYIVIKEGRELCKLFLTDIIYVDYRNHYVQIHTKTAIRSTYMKFEDFAVKLLKYAEFLKCYRCIIVNMPKIEKIEEGFFLMNNGEYIPINRNRAKEIKAQYTNYIFGVIDGE